MGRQTEAGIGWTDYTFNPWIGCTKVSPACDNCYAEKMAVRLKMAKWGSSAPRNRTSDANWLLPLSWDKKAAKTGVRYRVFCASMADVFDNEVDPQWRADLFALISKTPNLDWLLLTKRIGNAYGMMDQATEMMDSGMGCFAPSIYPNVWIGATICNQAEADRDIPKLLSVPAAKRFLSIEPMLGHVDLGRFIGTFDCHSCCNRFFGAEDNCLEPVKASKYASRQQYLAAGETKQEIRGMENGKVAESQMCPFCQQVNTWEDSTVGGVGEDYIDTPTIDWVICGGESGYNARPMHPDWARSLRAQCKAAGVPFFFKQWGEFKPIGNNIHSIMTDFMGMEKVGKKAAGRLLDGVEHDGAP
jgi:protein gp37